MFRKLRLSLQRSLKCTRDIIMSTMGSPEKNKMSEVDQILFTPKDSNVESDSFDASTHQVK